MRKVALITGASSGLGAELAKQLAAKDYDLALLARRRPLLEQLAQDLHSTGARVEIFEVDVTDFRQVQDAVNETERVLGPITLLVANAGVMIDSPLHRFDLGLARQVYEVNVIGLMNSCVAVAPLMMQRKTGKIVGISSLSAYMSAPRSGVYASSKAAVSSYLEGIRLELYNHNVKVVTICPGFISTPMTAQVRFTMPFLLTAQEAVQLTLEGIESGKELVNFPLPTYIGAKIFSCLPRFLVRYLMKLAYAKKDK